MGMYDALGDMLEILDDYVIETNELIDQLNQDLLLIEGGQDPDVINRIFRAFHTIKGTSGFLSFDTCMDLAHASEDLLNKVRNGELTPNTEVVDILLESADWFRQFIQDVEARVEGSYDISDIQARLSTVLKSRPAATATGSQSRQDPQPGKTRDAVPKLTEGLPRELIMEFVTESHEMIETVGNEVMSLEIEPDNPVILNEIFRVFHTLKGNSALIGLEQLSQVAHKTEDVLGALRENRIELEPLLVDTLLNVIDYVRLVLDEIRNDDLQRRDTAELLKALHHFLGEPDVDLPELESLEESPRSDTGTEVDPPVSGTSPPAKRMTETIRVDVNRLENLMNVAGELVLEKNRLFQLSQRIKAQLSGHTELMDLEGVNKSLGYISTEIQESVMKIRMLPIANVFRKFPRLVRDLAREKHKEIELVIEGEDTELDRWVIEAISDPLVHLLRNAIDHGIEDPDQRLQKGKPAQGTIELKASQEGNRIVIQIRDDGAGIDPRKVLEKGLEHGLISAGEAALLKSADIIRLILRPGFSTADQVTDVSGRGVGMDVVHTNISRLSGSLEIDSEPDKGTTFTIKLPLTLTILTGMVVRVWDEIYIIPLTAISETLRLDPGQISLVEGNEVIRVRETVLPILYLDQLLNVRPQPTPEPARYIVIVSLTGRSIGLVVSKLLGQEETVVKPLGRTLSKVKYLAGATLRGDGRVSLILDVNQFFDPASRAAGVQL